MAQGLVTVMILKKKDALLALCIVGVVFYASYGFANWFSAQRGGVPEIVFAWERRIPFWAWTIVPYWTLNVFYALAFFLCRSREELSFYIKQLLTAQVLAVACFLLFPLQFSWPKPPVDGFSGWLFTSLAAFDQPYNQAPSLHIMLVLIVGRFYWHTLPEKWRVSLVLWFALIAASVLTTYQHHFIDIPTGVLAGAVVLWLFPVTGTSPLRRNRLMTVGHYRWAAFYGVAALCLMVIACAGGVFLWSLWAAVSCIFLSAVYALFGAQALQKQADGRLSGAVTLLLLPYLAAVRLNMAYWLRGKAKSAAVNEKIHIGSLLAADAYRAVLDMCAEYPLWRQAVHYRKIPLLDMVAPSPADLRRAADVLQEMVGNHEDGPVLVCCALGYGRSAAVILTWLVRYGGCAEIDEAVTHLRRVRPQIVVPHQIRCRIMTAAR